MFLSLSRGIFEGIKWVQSIHPLLAIINKNNIIEIFATVLGRKIFYVFS